MTAHRKAGRPRVPDELRLIFKSYRVPPTDADLIQRAAKHLGQTETQFVLAVVVAEAKRVLAGSKDPA